MSLAVGGREIPDRLFIARTSANTFELGYYRGDARVVVASRTMTRADIGSAVGFYADVRTVGIRGSLGDLSLHDPNKEILADTLTVQHDFTLPAGATLDLNLFSETLHDRLHVGGEFNASGALRVRMFPDAPSPVAGDSFDLFDAGGGTVDFATLELPELAENLAWDARDLGEGILTVISSASDYTTWAAGQGLEPGADGPASDPDLDGVSNAFEWLFGSDPMLADPGVLPEVQIRSVNGTEFPGAHPEKRYLSLVATVRKDIVGMTLIPKAATSLELLEASESTSSIVSMVVEDQGEFEKREWIHTVPIDERATGFMRLEVVED